MFANHFRPIMFAIPHLQIFLPIFHVGRLTSCIVSKSPLLTHVSSDGACPLLASRSNRCDSQQFSSNEYKKLISSASALGSV